MPVHGLQPADNIIAKVFRDLKPDQEDFVIDAYEWIGEALGLIGAAPQYIDDSAIVKINNYRGLIPCGADYIKQVGYKPVKDKTFEEGKKVLDDIIPMTEATGTTHEVNQEDEEQNIEYQASYILNGNYIRTPFESGEIVIFYKGFPLDEQGYPKVPDSASYSQALYWYIVMKLAESGFKHPAGISFLHAEQRWKKYCAQSFTEAIYPSIDNYEAFRRQWTDMVQSLNQHDTFFNDLSQRGYGIGPGDYGQYGNQGVVSSI